MDKYKLLASNALLISIGTFGSKVLVFLMVRFYTEYLPPSDYGTADLLTQTTNLLIPFVSLGIIDGVFRFAIDHADSGAKIFTTGFRTVIMGTVILTASLPLWGGLHVLRGYGWLVVISVTASCLHSLCSQYIRAKGNTLLYAVQGVLNTSLVISLNIILLAVFHRGIAGYVLSVAAADLITALFLAAKEKLWLLLGERPDRPLSSAMFHYCVPLIPVSIFWWITSVSDRFMITSFLGSEATGIYAVSCKIPTIMTLLSSVFMEAWQFSAIAEADEGREAHARFFSRVWDFFYTCMFTAGALVTGLSKLEIDLLADEGYYEAWKSVPILTLAMIFSAFSAFLGSAYLVEKKSGQTLQTAALGAAVNICLNALLIPSPLWTSGAGIATLVSYLSVFTVRVISVRKLIPFKMDLRKIAAGTILLAIQSLFLILHLPLSVPVQAACVLMTALMCRKTICLGAKTGIRMGQDLLKRSGPPGSS